VFKNWNRLEFFVPNKFHEIFSVTCTHFLPKMSNLLFIVHDGQKHVTIIYPESFTRSSCLVWMISTWSGSAKSESKEEKPPGHCCSGMLGWGELGWGELGSGVLGSGELGSGVLG
jgi:hypothetical protein